MSKARRMQRFSDVFRHVTHAVLLMMLLAAVWLIEQLETLSGSTSLLLSGIMLGVGFTVSLVNIFLPTLPRLEREKNRTSPHHQMWIPILFFLLGGIFLALEVKTVTSGQPSNLAGAIIMIAIISTCVAVANARMCICWNDEGIVLRTIFGNIYRYGWEDLTGYGLRRSTVFLMAGRKTYALNLNAAQNISFLQYAHSRRSALGATALPRY